MRLNKREKYLLGLFIVGIVIMVFYKYYYAPHNETIQKLRHKIAVVENAVRINELQASSENNIYNDLEGVKAKIQDITSRFYPMIIQEKYILQMDDFIKSTGIDVYSISFIEPEKAFIEKAKEEEEEKSLLEGYVDIYKDISDQITLKGKDSANKEEKKVLEEEKSQEDEIKDKVEKLSASINFTADYDKVKAFMNKFHNLNRNVLINNLSMSTGGGQELICSMTIEYYALPQIEMFDADYLKWDINNKYGKDNPFIAFEGATNGYEISKDDKANTALDERTRADRQDFHIGTYPATADIPSVIIGDASNDDGKTYVYGDNVGYEDVEFYITKSQGKYYYKYRTQSQSYPVDYSSLGNGFYPVDNKIYLMVTSSKRKNTEDNNGIRVTIVNKSDLEVVLEIKDDDSKRPRVKIKDLVGKVTLDQ